MTLKISPHTQPTPKALNQYTLPTTFAANLWQRTLPINSSLKAETASFILYTYSLYIIIIYTLVEKKISDAIFYFYYCCLSIFYSPLQINKVNRVATFKSVIV